MPKHVNSRTCLGSDDQSITFSWDQQPNHPWLLHESCRTPSGNLWRCQPGPGAAVVLIAYVAFRWYVPSISEYYDQWMLSLFFAGPPISSTRGLLILDDPGIKGIEPSRERHWFSTMGSFLFGARIKSRCWMVLFEGHSWNFMTISMGISGS